MTTVKQQLIEALDGLVRHYGSTPRPDSLGAERIRVADLALDRARAEPKTHHREDLVIALEELFDEHYWDCGAGPWKAAERAFKAAISELSCPDICDKSCPCFQDGHQDGLEAQRERVG